MDWMSLMNSFLMPMIAAATPIAVEAVKKGVDAAQAKLPPWAVPIVAAGVGGVGEFVATGTASQNGVLAGLAATGIRDIISKLRRG